MTAVHDEDSLPYWMLPCTCEPDCPAECLGECGCARCRGFMGDVAHNEEWDTEWPEADDQ